MSGKIVEAVLWSAHLVVESRANILDFVLQPLCADIALTCIIRKELQCVEI